MSYFNGRDDSALQSRMHDLCQQQRGSAFSWLRLAFRAFAGWFSFGGSRLFLPFHLRQALLKSGH